MKRIIVLLIGLFTAISAAAGPYSEQLRTDPPHSGRIIAEDGTITNLADEIRLTLPNIIRGKIPGAVPLIAYGERTSAGAEVRYPIWPDGATIAEAPYGTGVVIQSTSINDTAGGTGVRSVSIHYLRQDFSPVDDLVITLNGTTSVPINDPLFRFAQCMHVTPGQVGSGKVAAGEITLTNPAKTQVYSQIPTGGLRCSSSYRMVPKGKRLIVDTAVTSSVSSTADTTDLVRLVSNYFEGHYYRDPLLFIPYASIGVQNNAIASNFPGGIGPLPEGTIIGCTHTSNKASTVSCDWFGHLEPVQ